MTVRCRARGLPLLVLICLYAAPAACADPPAPAWFVPPPAKPGIAGAARAVDMRRPSETDTITVTAERRPVQRNPHGEETHDFQPAHSEVASPSQGKIGQSYCGSAYQTLAGQPATGMDMASMGGGRC